MKPVFRPFGAVAFALLLGGGVCLPSAPTVAQSAETRVKIRLTGAAINKVRPEGSAEYRVRGARSSFSAEAGRVNLPDGTVLTVSVNAAAVGKITLKLGKGGLEIESSRRATVPAVKKGDIVTLTTANGATVLSGQF